MAQGGLSLFLFLALALWLALCPAFTARASSLSLFVDSLAVEGLSSSPLSIDDIADDVDIFADDYSQQEYADPVLELGLKLAMPEFKLSPKKSKELCFKTEDQYFVCANLNWKWVRIGYSFPFKNYTKGFDFNFSPRIGRCLITLEISNTRNYRLANPNDYIVKPDGGNGLGGGGSDNASGKSRDAAPAVDQEALGLYEDLPLDGLETGQWSLSVEWISDRTHFSPETAFSQSYSGGQRINAGSLIFGASLGADKFRMDASHAKLPQTKEVLQECTVKRHKIKNASLGCGYGYNFVFREGQFVVGSFIVPYLSLAQAVYDYNGSNYKQFSYGARVHLRLSCVYQEKWGFVSLSADGYRFYFEDRNFEYQRTLGSIFLSVAMKMGYVGLHHNLVPGHQIIDFVDKFF